MHSPVFAKQTAGGTTHSLIYVYLNEQLLSSINTPITINNKNRFRINTSDIRLFDQRLTLSAAIDLSKTTAGDYPEIDL